MVKRKTKNIKEIQAALLTNTTILGKEHAAEEEGGPSSSIINDDILMKFEALAEFEQADLSELLNKALTHFLKLKGLQVEQALNAKKNK